VTAEVVFLGQSTGICRVCRAAVPVRTIAEAGSVFLERRCPEHGTSRAKIADSLEWYMDVMQLPPGGRPPRLVRTATGPCPESCGPCEMHAQVCQLPVFSITNACNLRCPICFTYNREDRLYFMSRDEFARHLDFVVAAPAGGDLVNITGGEPTLHPELPELLEMARREGIGRVTVNSNGLELARRPDLVQRIAESGAYVVLSLDTLDSERSVRLHGRDVVAAKLDALDALERAGVPTTLLMVLVGGVNEDELPALLELTLGREHVRSLTIQTMTYTGQGGGEFGPRRHIPVDAVERRLEVASGGRIRAADFSPLPSAHPLCYGVAYLLRDGAGAVHPLAELLDRDTLARHLGAGYLLHPTPELEADLKRAIDRAWSEGRSPGLLATLRAMLGEMYPPGERLSVWHRQRRGERFVRTVYVHAHMDEDTFETGRVQRCPDQVPVDAARLVSACCYNLFYRQHDERFWRRP
jgi:7,8-dihydro-6-hydroxymethylpterin dimethyltransferase